MSSSDTDDEVERLQFKVIILGDGAVGKTSITRRFTNDEFQQSYLQTVGVDWFIKTILLPDDIEVTLQLWDIGGQELGSRLLSNYLHGSHAIVLTYDVTNYASFKNLQEWYQLVQSVFKDNLPQIALMANKSDMNHLRTVRKELHERWAAENNFLSFFVSAKTGDNVQASFYRLAGTLGQINIPKADLGGVGKVVTAQIVNHSLTDSTLPPTKRDQLEREEVRLQRKEKQNCILC